MGIRIFKRYWWVPARSANETNVPTTLDKFNIKYHTYKVIDAQTSELVGWTYEFDCVPGLYQVLKMALSDGNNFAPLEVILGK